MMRVRPSKAVCLVVATIAVQCSGTGAQTQGPLSPSGPSGQYRLVWSDEFDVSGLPDPSKWTYDVGASGWGNQELQFYTEGRPENARVEGGRLVVEARKDGWQGHDYTSARLNTRQGWTYGRVEVSARLPSGRGTWPAIWMLPVQWTYGNGGWPDNGEIDIMEHVGFDPDVTHASIHTAAYNHVAGTQKTATTMVAGAREGFHVYAVEWTPTEIRASVDGLTYFTFANERVSDPRADFRQWPFDRDFRILLNVAVGGTWGGQRGVDDSIWPQRLEVEYVRVYQR